jgi:hypothetical protein
VARDQASPSALLTRASIPAMLPTSSRGM